MAQASVAELREQAKVASEQAKDASDKAAEDSGALLKATKKTSADINNLRQESAAASRLADITAKSLAAAQLTATTDSSEAVRQAVATADSAARAAAADAEAAAAALKVAIEDSKASATASAGPATATPATPGRTPRPGYVDKMVTSLAKRAQGGTPEAQPGIDALESGLFTRVVNPGFGGIPRNVSEDEIANLLVLHAVNPPKRGATKLWGITNEAITEAGKKRLMGSSFPKPRPAGTPLSPSLAAALLASPPLLVYPRH